MRKLLMASGVAVALTAGGAARGADVGVPIKAPAPAVAAVDWTGFYVGAQGGVTSTSRLLYTFTNDLGDVETFRFHPTSFIGGGQIGAQWQFDKWVLGLEGTWSGVDLKSTVASTVTPGQLQSIGINQMATATFRFGATFDRAMLYAKGGYAGARFNIHSVDGGTGLFADSTRWSSGWTVGLGLDYMAFANFVVGAEFDYYNLRFESTGLYSDGVTPFALAGSNADIYALMARASYLFR